MRRNIEKAISEYDKIGGDRLFGLTDIGKILELSTDEDTRKVDLALTVINAIKLGYVVGYRRAKRQK